MGGSGSGRKPTFKTRLVLFGLDIQIAITKIINEIKNDNATFDEVEEKLIEILRMARRICEENERL
jgi:hypothetical protein